MAGPSFRSAADGNNNNVASHTCAIPTGVASLDVLIMSVLAYTNTGVPLSTPTGWTRINHHAGAGTVAGYNFALYSRIADGTEGSTVTLTSAAGCYSLISILAYQNAGGVDASGDWGSSQSTNTPQVPSVTSIVADDLILGIAQSANASSGDTASISTSGWSLRRSAPFFTALNAKAYFVEKAQPTAGASGVSVVTISSVATTANWTWSVAIKPSAPAAAPVADFTGTPTSGTASLSVAFTDTSTNTPTSWLWDFGDGATSTSQNPTHSYTTSGTFTVSLTATNTTGSNTKTRTAYIIVSETIVYAAGGGISIW